MDINADEIRHRWYLSHPEAGYQPTDLECALWHEAGCVDVIPPVLGGQGKGAAELVECSHAVALAWVGIACLVLGFLAGRLV